MRRMIIACVVLAAVVGCTSVRDGRTVKVSSCGFDPQDSTRFLQAAFDSGARKVVIDRQKGDWITRPLFITNSNLEVVLEDGATLRAMRGQFRDPHDSLIEIGGGASNVTLSGEGRAVLRMNKAGCRSRGFSRAGRTGTRRSGERRRTTGITWVPATGCGTRG